MTTGHTSSAKHITQISQKYSGSQKIIQEKKSETDFSEKENIIIINIWHGYHNIEMWSIII